MVEVFKNSSLIATLTKDEKNYVIDYKNFELKNSIALSLPNTKRYYIYENRFIPFFESFLPEGYLYEIFKQMLSKEYGYIDDYLIFSKLAPNIDSRLHYKSDFEKLDFDLFDKDEILQNDSNDTFTKLLQTFLHKNAISGAQPKTVSILKDKESLKTKEYIIKTWGDEFPNLAENEYFCLKAVKKAGVNIPNIELSKNKKFLLVENFTYKDEKFLGFEEVLSLMDKNRENKYDGSYEQVAKTIYDFTTNKKQSLKELFIIIVMSYLLKNGDAHLKNFALLFEDDFSSIYLSPAYDIVCTTAYIYKDKPALTMQGKKVWFSQKELEEFGVKYCLLSKKEATATYRNCINALKETINEIKNYIGKNPNFKTLGAKMIDSFELSLQNKTIKEIPVELIRAWREY